MRVAVGRGVAVMCLQLVAALAAAAPQASTLAEAARLLQQARELETAGKFAEGIPAAERALAAFESLGAGEAQIAEACMQLGTLQFRAGNFAAAAANLQRAADLREKTGGQPRAFAASLSSLANARRALGQLPEAADLFARSLAVLESAFGTDDMGVAEVLISSGSLQDARGDYEGAESRLKRARAIFEANGATNTLAFAQLLGNLGQFYRRNGALEQARAPLERSLAIREQLFAAKSPNHPQLVPGLAGLAALYQEMGQFDLAEPLHRRVLAAFEANQPTHPAVATVLTNLAMIRTLRDDHRDAEALFRRALQIREQMLGPRHADVASTLEKLAVLYQLAARPADALTALARSAEILEENLQLMLASGSEQERLNYMTTVRENTDIALSMRASQLADDERAAAVAAAVVLRRKGRVLDAMVTVAERLRHLVTPDDVRLLEELAAARSQLATLLLQPGGAADRVATTRALESRIETLEASLSARSRQAQGDLRPVGVAAVQQKLPGDTVLVEYVQYRPFDPRVIGQANRFGPPRYAAVVLRQAGAPRWVELGPSAAIDERVAALRAALRSPASGDVRPQSRELAARVLDPLEPELRGASRVVVAPDGELSVIPFAALVDAGGRYLIERVEIGGLASGRDLLRADARPPPREPPLIVADPVFQSGNAGAADGPAFEPLPGTAQEASALRGLLPDARVATKDAASESRVKAVRGPRLLHVATHGFFFNPAAVSSSRGTEERGLTLELQPAESSGRFALLRSGLALSGANTRQGGAGEDGLLTALEAASLDLYGTQLVVLSACETGLGEVRSGDGVHGLRRALTLAGAETQVMSLWQVSDQATRDLMIGFYRRLIARDGRAAAMRAVQLEWLRGGDRTHPFYWASFVVSGAWSPMQLK